MVDKLITYLESDYRYPRGHHLDLKEKNADQTLKQARQRVQELHLKYIVVASYSGRTAIKVAQAFKGVNVRIIAVVGWGERMRLSVDNQRMLEELSVILYRGTHTFHGASSALISKFGGVSGVGIIQETLRLFSQGTKVCVEIALMAADAGLVPVDEDIMTLGGTGQWCDTAIILKSAFANKLFDPVEGLEIKEIVVFPRNKMIP